MSLQTCVQLPKFLPKPKPLYEVKFVDFSVNFNHSDSDNNVGVVVAVDNVSYVCLNVSSQTICTAEPIEPQSHEMWVFALLGLAFGIFTSAVFFYANRLRIYCMVPAAPAAAAVPAAAVAAVAAPPARKKSWICTLLTFGEFVMFIMFLFGALAGLVGGYAGLVHVELDLASLTTISRLATFVVAIVPIFDPILRKLMDTKGAPDSLVAEFLYLPLALFSLLFWAGVFPGTDFNLTVVWIVLCSTLHKYTNKDIQRLYIQFKGDRRSYWHFHYLVEMDKKKKRERLVERSRQLDERLKEERKLPKPTKAHLSPRRDKQPRADEQPRVDEQPRESALTVTPLDIHAD